MGQYFGGKAAGADDDVAGIVNSRKQDITVAGNRAPVIDVSRFGGICLSFVIDCGPALGLQVGNGESIRLDYCVWI